MKGELTIPNPYNKLCFRTAICDNKYIDYNDIYNKLFIDTDIFIIEICSNKKYMHNGFYLHHLCVDKRISHLKYKSVLILKMNQDEIVVLYNVRRTVFQMLRDRGYTVSDQSYNQSLEDFKRGYNNSRESLNMLFTKP